MKTLPILIWFVGTTMASAQEPTPDVAVTAMPEFAVAPRGASVRVAVRLSVPDGWHIGWVNPGRLGSPTALSWHAPRSLVGGRPLWPYPILDTTGATPANVYRGDVVVLTRFDITADAPLAAVEVRGTLSWELCRDVCIRQARPVTASFRIDTALTERSAGWAEWEEAGVSFQPVRLRPRFVSAAFDKGSVRITVLLPGGPPRGSPLMFFPAQAGRPALVVPVHTGRSAWWARLPLDARDGVGRVAGLLVVSPTPGQPGNVAFAVDAHVQGRLH
ncbi:MAG: protein-disulfide reductase DsbD domain-containing protein [Gemmatimonadales bacterium]